VVSCLQQHHCWLPPTSSLTQLDTHHQYFSSIRINNEPSACKHQQVPHTMSLYHKSFYPFALLLSLTPGCSCGLCAYNQTYKLTIYVCMCIVKYFIPNINTLNQSSKSVTAARQCPDKSKLFAARCYASVAYVVMRCLSVCPSVCLSRS